MTKFGKLTIFGIVIAILVVAGFSVWFFNATKKITTYEECVNAGRLVRKKIHYDSAPLFPNKYECVLWGGKSFEKYEEIQEAATVSLKDIEISLRDWYTHRMSDTYILLTKQQELPDIGNTELYAYGEQISINVMPIDTSPEAWIATRIDLDDVLTLNSEWSTYYGQTLLTVESEAGGASGKQYTQYLFTDDVVYMISLYPLEIYDNSSKTYDRNTTAVYDIGRVLFRLRPYILEQESVQRQLAENCANAEIPLTGERNTVYDSENKILEVSFWNGELQEDILVMLPYEPETDFAGCSNSAKDILRHIQELNEENIRSGKE